MSKTRLWRSVGIGATAAAGMYLFDPDRGRSRRAKLADQAAALFRKSGERVGAQVRYQRGVAQGAMHKMAEPFQPEEDIDDHTLLQKVRSEALGRWPGPKRDVEVDVEAGTVTLRGPVTRERAKELVQLVAAVDGVEAVSDEMTVSQRG